MLIERGGERKSLITLYQSCLQNVPLKAVVFSKVFVPGFPSQPLLFY